MASLLFAGPILAYEKFKAAQARRAARKAETASRFSELETANRERIAALQQHTPFCHTSDWSGGGCPRRGPGDNIPIRDAADVMAQQQRSRQDDGVTAAASPSSHPERDFEEGEMRREDTMGTTEMGVIDAYARGATRGKRRDEEAELVVPDVRHVVPLRYEDVRMRKEGGGPCRRKGWERVVRRKVECGEREVVR
ncbi:MAG: hypothetical protein LQ339_000146 [Xanthoria mediterranea]|nr:MAG: hypothetical protein LQ339_000146 [Xanthoria mediterranea]